MTYKCTGPCGRDLDESAYGTRLGARRVRCRDCINAAQKARRERQTPEDALVDEVVDGGAELRSFGPEIEQACAEAVSRLGSVKAAADELRLTPRQLRAHLSELVRRAASRGWHPGSDMVKPTAQGFHVKGVSTYYDDAGNVRGQWVKTKRDESDRLAQLADAVASIADDFKGAAEPVVAPEISDDDLLCVYPMGDPHLGMYAWAAETGAPFNLEIAERNLVAAVDHLVDLAPAASTGLIIVLGDFFHADNKKGETTAGTKVDVDTRWSKLLATGIRTMRRTIDRALGKHERVHVIVEIGNHDEHTAQMLALCLANYYEREPRVEIDTSPAKFHWYRFGQNLIGVTHGDTCKLDDLPGVMSCDRARDWGETVYRMWYTGHVHHDRLRELPGCTAETFRTLAPKDSWHHAKGYRSDQDMKLDVIHRQWGPIMRHRVGIRQLLPTEAQS